MGGLWWATMVAAALALAGAPARAAPSASPERHVLILNSYHPQYAWTDALVRGALDELGTVVPDENIHVEYMDMRRMLDDRVYLGSFERLMVDKYRGRVPALILASDDGATRFLLERRTALFPGAPVVFCGVNSIDRAELEAAPAMTGILEGLEIEGNLRLIERLHPAVARIVLLADRSSLGRGMTDVARAIPADLVDVPVEIWDDFSIGELRQRMAAASADTVFLLLAIHRDRDGAYFSFDRELPGLTASSRAPLYAMFGMLIGSGVVGGLMNDPEQHGRAAAAMARRVLAGEPIDSIPIVAKADYTPQFDWAVLDRLGIDEARLPPDSVVHGRPVSFYRAHRRLVWQVVAVMIGLVLVIVVLLHVVVRMRRAERALVASHRALQRAERAELIGQLTGGIAHDFNNLLVPVLVGASLLRSHLGVRALADLEMIEVAAARAQELVARLLAYGRDEPLALRPVDLAALLPSLVSLLGRSAGPELHLDLVPADGGLVVTADPSQIERIVVNLVMNARDAAVGDRRVKVTVRVSAVEIGPDEVAGLAPGRHVCIAVADDGAGMDAATLARIFEPFFTTKQRGLGAGLGLSTVRSIVAQHGGAITAESTPGQGSLFRIYLPASDRPAPAAEPTAAPAETAAAHGTILVVDDEPLIRGVAEEVLRRRGYHVLTASDAKAAAEVAERWRGDIDLVITALELPDAAGRAVASRLKARRPGAHVLYMSGRGDQVADAPVLAKPFHAVDLLAAVRGQLGADVGRAATRTA
jgi:signal transduction histidine kinase